MKKYWNWNITIEGRNYRVDLEYNIGLIRNMKIHVNGHLVRPIKINKGESGSDYFFSINNHECCIYSRTIGEDLYYSVALRGGDLITGEEVEYVKVPPKEEEPEVKRTKKEMAVRAMSLS